MYQEIFWALESTHLIKAHLKDIAASVSDNCNIVNCNETNLINLLGSQCI